jgi:hypothetical protein
VKITPKDRKNIMNTLLAKGKLKQKPVYLLEEELQFTEGKEDELPGRNQTRQGQAR